MPDLPGAHGSVLTLRLPLRLPASPGLHEVRFPTLPGVCPGRIVEIRGAAATVSDDRRQARIPSGSPSESAGELVVTWDMGHHEDRTCFYDRFPPFFLEGEPAVLDTIERMLQPTTLEPGRQE
jgi:hypothetical protein